jgi:hypothetical protein
MSVGMYSHPRNFGWEPVHSTHKQNSRHTVMTWWAPCLPFILFSFVFILLQALNWLSFIDASHFEFYVLENNLLLHVNSTLFLLIHLILPCWCILITLCRCWIISIPASRFDSLTTGDVFQAVFSGVGNNFIVHFLNFFLSSNSLLFSTQLNMHWYISLVVQPSTML